MTENGGGIPPIPSLIEVTETITVPDRDLSPSEMARIMRQVAHVTNFLASLVMRQAGLSSRERVVGAGHPITQSIIACAAQADAAAINLEGPSQVATGGPQVVPVQRRPS